MLQRFFPILVLSVGLLACSGGGPGAEDPPPDASLSDVEERGEPDTVAARELSPDIAPASGFDSSEEAQDALIAVDEGHEASGHTQVDVESEELPPGAIAGRVVNSAGEGLAGIKMLACTVNLCVSGETDDYGEYFFDEISAEPQKMQATDATGEYMAVLFYQECVSEAFSSLSREVVLPLRESTELPWPEEQAGTILLAGGWLELSVEAESLQYPLGFFDQTLVAEAVPGTLLPPFNKLPWEGLEDSVQAFYFYPLHIMADPPASLRARIEGAKAGEVYEIWSVNPDTAKLKLVGEGVADEESWVDGGETASVEHLSILVFSRKP